MIDSAGKSALVGIGIPADQSDISATPALSAMGNLYNTEQPLTFTRTNPNNPQDIMGTITFPAGLNIVDNRIELYSLHDAIQVVALPAPVSEYYVEVNTGTLSFLQGKAASVTINGIPYSAVKVVCSDSNGEATNLQLANGTLTFDVNHFSRYTVLNDPAPAFDAATKTYTITNASELVWLANEVNDGNTFAGYTFVLAQDVDLSAYDWVPIGADSIKSFSGTFDGNGKNISNLKIGTAANPNLVLGELGLFGWISGAAISNVSVKDVAIYSSKDDVYAGGLVGYATNSSVTGSCVTGILTGGDSAVDYTYVGGLIGYSDKMTITNCYASVQVTGGYDVTIGGLVGFNIEGIAVTNCYSTGLVTGGSESHVGGLIGLGGTNVTNSYYDMETSGQTDTGKGTPLTTTQMKTQAEYVGWDFTGTWQIAEGQSYPTLQWQTPDTDVPMKEINISPTYIQLGATNVPVTLYEPEAVPDLWALNDSLLIEFGKYNPATDLSENITPIANPTIAEDQISFQLPAQLAEGYYLIRVSRNNIGLAYTQFMVTNVCLIQGTVTDSSGHGLPGIKVEANSVENWDSFPLGLGWGNIVETASDGTYQLPVPAGTYKIGARGNSTNWWAGQYYLTDTNGNPVGTIYREDAQPVEIAGVTPTTGIDFNLVQGGTISGVATEFGTGNAVPHAMANPFLITGDRHDIIEISQCRTDANGQYVIGPLPAGVYGVAMDTWDTGHERECFNDKPIHYQYSDVAALDSITVIAGQDQTGKDFVLQPAGTISGRVTDSSSRPLANVWVEAYGADNQYISAGYSNADGYYEIRCLPLGGQLKIQAAPSNDGLPYLDQWYSDKTGPDQADLVSFAAGTNQKPDIDFVLQGAGISGTVQSATGPLSGVNIMALDSSDLNIRYGGESDQTGAYSINVPIGKQYYILAYPGQDGLPYANSFFSTSTNHSFEDATPVDPGTTSIDFTLAPGGSISGTVKDGSGQPIIGMRVRCQQTDGGNWYDWVITDASGQYILAGLPYGTYTVASPPTDTEVPEEIEWVQAEISVVVDQNNIDVSGKDLILIEADYPVVTDFWPKWAAVDATEIWIDLQGVKFDTLGTGMTLQLRDGNGGLIAQSNEINVGPDGRWMNARAIPIAPLVAGTYTISLTDASLITPEFRCANSIGITAEPFVYGEVIPWAINGQGETTLSVSGDNLTSLGTAPFAVNLVNEEDPLQSIAGTALVSIIPGKGEYLDISFNSLDLEPGSYYITAVPTIHGMVQNSQETDLSIWLEVVDTPAVTGVRLQETTGGNYEILIDGINFDQFTTADLGAMAVVLQGQSLPNPLTLSVTRLTDMQLQVALPAVPTDEVYNLSLVLDFGTDDENWLPRAFGFYLPVINGEAHFLGEGYLEKNEVFANQAWASENFQIDIYTEGYTRPVEQLEGLIKNENLPGPIPVPLAMIENQLTLDVPAGLLRVGNYQIVLREKRTGRELGKIDLFIDNNQIPVIYKERPEMLKYGNNIFKLQFDGSSAIKNIASCSVKLIDSNQAEIATAYEVNWDNERGRYLEAMFNTTASIGKGQYTILIETTPGQPIQCLYGSNVVTVTDQPFVYPDVYPWAVTGQTPFALTIRGQNLIGLTGLTLSLVNNGGMEVLSSDSVSIGNDGKTDYMDVYFSPASAPLAEGWYTLESNQTSEIALLPNVRLLVSSQPLVTGANIQFDDTSDAYTLVIIGNNFDQIPANDGLKVLIRRDGNDLAEVSVDSLVHDEITVELSDELFANGMNGYYEIRLFAEQTGAPRLWFERKIDFEIRTDPIWVEITPNHRNPDYPATTITASQDPQQAWEAGETLQVQIRPLGSAQAVTGIGNLTPTAVTDTSLSFTLPVGLGQGAYVVAILREGTLIAKGRIQIGGPWITTSPTPLTVGYSAATLTVNQEGSAFWQAGDTLTLNVMLQQEDGEVAPTGFETPIIVPGASVTATDFSFTLNAGLAQGNYSLKIKRGDVNLTGAPLAIAAAPVNAVISPVTITYDRSIEPLEDLQVGITWNQATSVSNIQFYNAPQDMTNPLGTSYWEVNGNNLIIKKAFLLQIIEKYDYIFNVYFNNSTDPVPFTVKLINNPPGPVPISPSTIMAGSPVGFTVNLSTMYFSNATIYAEVRDANQNVILPAQAVDPGCYTYNLHFQWPTVINTPGQYQLLVYDGNPVNPSTQLKAAGNFEVIPYVATNTAPTATNVLITGSPIVGQTLTAEYTYADADNDVQGASIIEWYTSDSPQGNYTGIDGATGLTYTVTAADLGKYIFVWVKPVAATGVLQGATVISPATAQVLAQNTTIVYGDLNGENGINSTDLGILKAYLLGKISVFPNDVPLSAADLNGVNGVNSTDLGILKAYLLEKISEFPVSAQP